MVKNLDFSHQRVHMHACSQVLDEIRPYLVGTGGGGLELDGMDDLIVKVRG